MSFIFFTSKLPYPYLISCCRLLALARERQEKLNETVKAYVLVREAAELANWIKDKEMHAQVQDVGEDLEQVCLKRYCIAQNYESYFDFL